ncbi:hypothetical protein IQ37_13250 [Chryseobacterium piperi]|uniref:Chemotaxis methyl-accepting receptor HlyB-like 4HB MCP domain-containing protein n=1 Tax=Chryseobacterium piperi TaxID=558152 RepID=A0A086B602_9FLAO|nr:type VI secretion system TssO [Chryseobacterium piperi]ASW74487.1 hypothetical protein CJF12_09460 [Chryseobacterium piperi]KFF24366.1 hypothetical protein IQ37_13250 [Chryseobacterium piperi]
MSSNRERKLNKSDVRTGIWKFVLSFVVLAAVSFTSVFFFFKSYDTQTDGISREAENYRQLLGRSDILRVQVDTIFSRMSRLNRVENDIFLRNDIIDNVNNAKNIMGKDSVDNFKHYSSLMKQIRPMLNLKNQIVEVSNKKKIAIRDLNLCTGKVAGVESVLAKDPTRKFSGSRRKR